MSNLPTYEDVVSGGAPKKKLPGYEQLTDDSVVVPPEPTPVSLPKIGKLASAWEGARQGLTFGLSDEASGLVHAGLEKLTGGAEGVDPSFKPTFKEAYQSGRDADRAFDNASKRANPLSHLVGDLAGNTVSTIAGGGLVGKVLPGAVKAVSGIAAARPVVNAAVRAAASGGLQGLVNGLGRSNAQGTVENLADAGLGGVTGAVVGGALGAAGKGVAEAAKAKLASLGADADRLRVLTAMGATGGTIAKPRVLQEAERVPGGVPEVARVMRETGMTSRFGTTQGLLAKATEAQRQADDVIGSVIADVDNSGQKVDAGAFAKRLRNEALGLSRRPEMDGVAKALTDRAGTYESRFPGGMSMSEAQRNVSDLGKGVNWLADAQGKPLGAGAEGSKAATRALREQMDAVAPAALGGGQYEAATGAAKQVFPNGVPHSAIDAYQQARRAHQVADIVGTAADESLGRASKRNFMSLSDSPAMELGAAAATAAGVPSQVGSILGFVGRHALAPRSAATRATIAETARDLTSSPVAQARIDGAGPASVAALRAYLNAKQRQER